MGIPNPRGRGHPGIFQLGFEEFPQYFSRVFFPLFPAGPWGGAGAFPKIQPRPKCQGIREFCVSNPNDRNFFNGIGELWDFSRDSRLLFPVFQREIPHSQPFKEQFGIAGNSQISGFFFFGISTPGIFGIPHSRIFWVPSPSFQGFPKKSYGMMEKKPWKNGKTCLGNSGMGLGFWDFPSQEFCDSQNSHSQ